MRHTLYIITALTSLLAVSCQKHLTEEAEAGGETSFSAVLPASFETKTYLSGLSTIWKSGDEIQVNGITLAISNGSTTRYAQFSGSVAGTGSGSNEYLAGYPAASTTYTSGTLTLTIPAVQTNSTVEQLSGQMPMAAFGKTDANGNTVLNFRNAANILKLNLYGTDQTVSRIKISSPDVFLAGTIKATPSGDDNVTFSDWTGTSKTITVNCPTPITIGTTAATATAFYILIPKISGNTVLTIKTYSTDGLYQKNTITVSDSKNTHLKNNTSNYLCATAPHVLVPTEVDGTLPGQFSVSADKKVQFSQGNLQWSRNGGGSTATTHSVIGGSTADGTWRFAENQWDMVDPNNNLISTSSYSPTKWIDCFGFGTSGYNSLAPTTYTSGASYPNSDISGTNNDWGYYNAISNGGDKPGIWMTLTSSEWLFLLGPRIQNSVVASGGYSNGPNYSNLGPYRSGSRYAKATVNGIKGIIIFPDGYSAPSSSSPFSKTITLDGVSKTINYVNECGNHYAGNTITLSDWVPFENNGFAFLPCNAMRNVSTMSVLDGYGNYWTGTYRSGSQAYYMWTQESNFQPFGADVDKYYGFSVRLVRDYIVITSANTQDYELNLVNELPWD